MNGLSPIRFSLNRFGTNSIIVFKFECQIYDSTDIKIAKFLKLKKIFALNFILHER